MTVERTRVEVASLNLANANTVRSAQGALYQPMRVVARTQVVLNDSFSARFDQGAQALPASSLPTASLEVLATTPRVVYDPSNPVADAKGNVSYASVDTATEMVTMLGAVRSYEANVAAMNMGKTLALRALNIGGASS